eukprot:s621_g11.t3
MAAMQIAPVQRGQRLSAQTARVQAPPGTVPTHIVQPCGAFHPAAAGAYPRQAVPQPQPVPQALHQNAVNMTQAPPRQVTGWYPHASFTAAPPGVAGFTVPPAQVGCNASPLPAKHYGTVPPSGSAAAPPGAPARCQVRVHPRISAASQVQASPTLTSPRRAGSPPKSSPTEANALHRSSRMRYSSAERDFEKGHTNVATVLTTQQAMPSPPAQRPVPKAGVRGAYRSSSSSSSLDGSPRHLHRGPAFERALSAGVRVGESPSLARGATASSSSALPLTEATGPVRRSSAGSSLMASSVLARQRSGRRPGSKSPPRNAGQNVTRRPSGGPPSSRGTPGRKSAVSIAVTGGGSAPSEPEAEAEPSHRGAEDFYESPGREYAAQVAAAAAAGQDMAPLLPREKLKPAEVKDVDGELKLVVQLMPQEIIKWKDIKLVKPISMGSFGEVFLARLKNLDVSVKRSLLRPDGSMTPEQLRNLEREINSYRKLNQTQAPCIVKYIGCILEHPNLAVVTEFLPNGNLFDLLHLGFALVPEAVFGG